MYNTERTAQAAAYFLLLAKGSVPGQRLLRLMYLADREWLLKNGSLLTGDTYAATQQGPELHRLNKTALTESASPWTRLIRTEEDGKFALRDPQPPKETLDLLSPAAETLITRVFEQYGRLPDSCFESATLAACPEWHKPQNGIEPIQYLDVLLHHGFTSQQAQELLQFLDEQESYDKLIRDLR